MPLRFPLDQPGATPEDPDVALAYHPDQRAAIGADVALFTDWLDTALLALVALRTGSPTGAGGPAVDLSFWHTVVNDLDHRLLPRLQGIRDAAIRAHAGAGGTVRDLALAMDVAPSTAQYRRERVLDADPSFWETWAREGGPQRPTES